MAFGPEGLTLGAGTVLAATDDERNIALDEAAEARLQALSGFGVALLNRVTGNMVNFDDCQRSTGIMYEYKGPTYTPFLQRANENEILGPSATKKMIKQATNQIQAAEGKHIVWLFADRYAAKDVRDKLDNDKNEALKTIEIRIFPSFETIK